MSASVESQLEQEIVSQTETKEIIYPLEESIVETTELKEVEEVKEVQEVTYTVNIVESREYDNPFKRATAINLELRSFHITRKAPGVKTTGDVNRKMLRWVKYILDSEEWKEINKFDSKIRAYLSGICMPTLYKDGIYAVPNPLILEVDEKLKSMSLHRQTLVKAFKQVYPGQIENARREAAMGGLGELFSDLDYPHEDVMEAKYQMNWGYISIDVPTTLKEISSDLFRREEQRAIDGCAELVVDMRNIIRAETLDFVNHMVDRLTPDQDGKPKKFKYTFLDNLKEFFRLFDARNSVTEDLELAKIVDEAKAVFEDAERGLELYNSSRVRRQGRPKKNLTLAEFIRKNEETRDIIKDGFANVKSKLNDMIIVGGRSIVFEDDDNYDLDNIDSSDHSDELEE